MISRGCKICGDFSVCLVRCEMYILEETAMFVSSHCHKALVRWKVRGRKKRNCNCSQFKEARLWKVSVNTYCHHDKDLPFDHWNMVHRRRRKLLCFINDSTASHWIPLDTFCHKAFIARVLITLKRGMNNGPQEIGLVTTNPEDRYAASVPMKSQWILLYVSWSVITWRLLSLMAAVVRWWPSVLCLFNGSIHKSFVQDNQSP